MRRLDGDSPARKGLPQPLLHKISTLQWKALARQGMDEKSWLSEAELKARRLKGPSHSGIWIPRAVEEYNPGEKISRTFSSWGDVFRDRPIPSLPEISHLISRYNKLNLLEALSKLNCLRHNVQSQEGKLIDVRLLVDLYPPEVFSRLLKLQESRGSATLSRSMLSMLQSLCLTSCTETPGVPLKDDLTTIGMALLACGSHCEGLDIERLKHDGAEKQEIRDVVFGSMYRNFTFNSIDRIAWTLTRYWLMLSECTSGIREAEKFDIDTATRNACGVSWQSYLAYGYTCLAYYLSANPKDLLNGRGAFMLRKSQFSQTKSATEAAVVLAGISKPIESLTKDRVKAGAPRAYDFHWLYLTPLVRIADETFFPMDLASLATRVTSGVYWQLHQALRNGPDFNRFKSYWGRLFEVYVRRILEGFLPNDRGLTKRLWIEHVDSFEGGVDFIIIDGADAAFIQVTTEHLPIFTVLSGEWKAIENSIFKLLIEREGEPGKARKLGTAIARFRRGELKLKGINPKDIRRIYPIIVMEQGISQIPGITTEIRALVAKETEFKESAEYLEFWDIEELEMCEDLFRTGITQFIDRKHASGNGEMPLKNYILESGYSGPADHMVAAHNRATSGLKGVLFG